MRLFPLKSVSGPVLAIAWPVVIGMISRTFMSLVDTAMVGRLGPEALAAVGLSAVAVWMVVGALFDVSIGTQAVVSRRYGENNPAAAGEALNATLFLSLIAGVAASLLCYSGAGWFTAKLTADPVIQPLSYQYFSIRVLEALPVMVTASCRGFFDGIGATRVHMRVTVIANILNVLLNYLLIFGHFGFPRLEVAGAALGTLISNSVAMVLILWVAWRPRFRTTYGIPSIRRWRGPTLRSIIRLSSATASRTFLVLAGFTVFLVMIGKVSATALAASHIVINISMLSWMPGIGMGVAVTTLVGQQLGAGNPDKAESFAWEGVRLAWCSMGVLGMVFLLAPGAIIRIFTSDPETLSAGIPALRILGVSQFMDPFAVVLLGALQGAGKTLWVMLTEVGVIWLFFLPATYWLALENGYGLLGGWSAFLMYVMMFSIMLVVKFRLGDWKISRI